VFGANTRSQFLSETLDPNGCSCHAANSCSVPPVSLWPVSLWRTVTGRATGQVHG